MLYLDLDLFKRVNDNHGHGAGDDLLKQVANRLKNCVRRTDTVSRLGGDEFAILLTDFDRPAFAGEVAEKIAHRLSEPFLLNEVEVNISTSVGISIFPDDGHDAGTLLLHADTAMYHAKALGRGRTQFFAQEMNQRTAERHALEQDLKAAIAKGQLSLYFQPQLETNSAEMIGAEVLLRWHHPQQGLVSPARFIPIAEESGHLMVSLGNWVLENVCKQARAWLDAGYSIPRLSVNVSAVQFRDDQFLQQLESLLHHCHLRPHILQLELTESIIMSEVEGATDRVRTLKDMGVCIAIDDFGTGYSSLSYLKDLPVDELKIDQSFVHNIQSDRDSAAIVEAVIRMGESLKLRVIAEGVENGESFAFLAQNGCEGLQGYHFSKPIPAAAFERQYLINF